MITRQIESSVVELHALTRISTQQLISEKFIVFSIIILLFVDFQDYFCYVKSLWFAVLFYWCSVEMAILSLPRRPL